MPAASNTQVQKWADERDRVRSESVRALINSLTDDIASFDSVYMNLTNSPNWVDSRTDVPNGLTPSDMLALNAFRHDVQTYILAHGAWPVVEKACVRPVNG